jgi:hypothetical protein
MTFLKQTALLAAGAATLIASTPAMARDGRWGRGDGIDAGDVIAGALIIGGIAAIATAASSNDRNGRNYGRSGRYDDYGRGYDDSYRDNRNGYGSRTAVDQCVRAAQRYGWARVTDVSSINRVRGGYEIRGRLVVEDRGNDRGQRYGRGYDRGYGRDRGYNYDRYDDGYDKGRFTCVTRYDRIDDLRVSGLRGGSYR